MKPKVRFLVHKLQYKRLTVEVLILKNASRFLSWLTNLILDDQLKQFTRLTATANLAIHLTKYNILRTKYCYNIRKHMPTTHRINCL